MSRENPASKTIMLTGLGVEEQRDRNTFAARLQRVRLPVIIEQLKLGSLLSNKSMTTHLVQEMKL